MLVAGVLEVNLQIYVIHVKIKCSSTGKANPVSKMTDLECGSKTICQAQGLTKDFGQALGCVDIKGNNITSSSCIAGDRTGMDYLRCDENCYIACQDGLDKYGLKEIYEAVESTEDCQQLCELTKGCSAYKLQRNGEKCTLKFGTQTFSSETCRGRLLFFVNVLNFCGTTHSSDNIPVPCKTVDEKEEVGPCSGTCGGGYGEETVTIRVRKEREAQYGGACDLSTKRNTRRCQNKECCTGNKPVIPRNASMF